MFICDQSESMTHDGSSDASIAGYCASCTARREFVALCVVNFTTSTHLHYNHTSTMPGQPMDTTWESKIIFRNSTMPATFTVANDAKPETVSVETRATAQQCLH